MFMAGQRQPASYCCIFVSQDSGNSKLVAFNCSPQQAPPLPPSFTCPPLHERYAGPFLGTHAGFKWGPCCPRPLLASCRHAWTYQLRIRLLLLGQSQGPRCSPQLQRATSVCVRGDEKRSQQSVSSGGHSAPSGRHHVVLAGEGVTQPPERGGGRRCSRESARKGDGRLKTGRNILMFMPSVGWFDIWTLDKRDNRTEVRQVGGG